MLNLNIPTRNFYLYLQISGDKKQEGSSGNAYLKKGGFRWKELLALLDNK